MKHTGYSFFTHTCSPSYIYIYIPPPRVVVCKGFDKIEINTSIYYYFDIYKYIYLHPSTAGWWYVKGLRSTPDWCIIKTQEMSRVNKNNSDIYIPPPCRVLCNLRQLLSNYIHRRQSMETCKMII